MGLLWGTTPEQDQISLLAGSALLGGQNVGQQLGGIGPAIAPVLAQQAQNKQNETVKNQTLNMLRGQNPELAQLVETGALTPTDAVKQYLQQRAEAQKAQQPDYGFLNVDGRIVRTDKNSGNINELADYSKPKLPAIAEEYNWAKQNGFDGTPQEYQAWKANLSKTGMTVEYDPVNGFRMTQGNVDGNKPAKMTEQQSKDINFLTRVKKAEEQLVPLESQLTDWAQKRLTGLPLDIGNYFKSADYQKAEQAGREVLAIILRKDTGAAVTPQEFDVYGKIYLPQPGDDAATIEAKRLSRAAAIKGIQAGLGPLAPQDDEAALPKTTADPIPAEDYFK